MQTTDLNKLNMFEAWYENDPDVRIRADFPFTAATGNATTSMVYFEIEPGHRLGSHTDSAEEIIVVLEGTIEATLGEESGRLEKGQAVLVPAMVPHAVRSIGQQTARCIGFFSAAGVESVFDQPVMPFGQTIMSTVTESAV